MYSMPQFIPDRSVDIKNGTYESAKGMYEYVKRAISFDRKAEYVMGIPCNTFHAPAIFDRFIDMVEKEKIDFKVINMIKEAAKCVKDVTKGKRLGLMSTDGTRDANVYQDVLDSMGYEIIQVPDDEQPKLMDLIYNHEWGIKSLSRANEQVRIKFKEYATYLKDQGADAIILGCTEIPMAFPESEYPGNRLDGIPLIDPMLALARALIREVDPKKLM